jgi:hypothetical protein
VLDTENIENPFSEAAAEEKVILGGRSIRVYSDSKEDKSTTPVRRRLARTL